MSAKIFIAFTIVSISSMFPNNAFMNAHEYFYYKLRNVTHDEDPVEIKSSWFIKQQPEKNHYNRSIDKDSRELAGSIISLIGVTAATLGGVLGVLVIKLV
uniref:Uncharacterized protein n=1 Tax=Caenorhabditis japonica TaxID=281687 RepID=A0A8R1HST1_CAEJA